MAQARGALVRLLFQNEANYRTAPSPAAVVMPFTNWDVKRTPNRQQDPTVNQSALRNKSNPGDPVVSGSFESVLELRTIGYWLKLLFGAPTTGKAVTTQPVNITGVTVHHASSDCTTGAGTLDFTSSGTTLTWAPQGGAAGTPVNVGAGGSFTLEGGGGGKSIRITVNAADLPVGNASDATINVSTTLKAHVFPINTTLRPSALIEAQHSDLTKFYRTLGLKVGELGWDVLANDQNIRGTVMAAVETVEGSAFDANPTVLGPVRACSGKGRIYDGGTGLGTVVGGSVSVNNNLTGYPCADGLEGYGFIDNGELAIGGSIRTVFDGAGAYEKARDGTSTRLRLETAAPVGADTFKLVLDAPTVELTENMPPKTGMSGLFADLAWSVHKGTDPEVYLVNDVTAYT
jgi:hypothetical protein